MSGDRFELATWRRIRQYAVPARMIEGCAQARQAGDWPAACAAGEVDPAFDPTALATRFGSGTAAAIEADLHALAPDLLRWHLPRALGGRTTLATRKTMVLSRRGSALLVVRLPVTVDGSQRLTLDLVTPDDLAPETVTLPAYLWDTRHSPRLREALGGSPARMPRFDTDGTPLPVPAWGSGDDRPARAERALALAEAGDVVGAWAEAGVILDATSPDRNAWRLPRRRLLGAPLDPHAVAEQARWLAAAHGGAPVAIEFDQGTRVRIDHDGDRLRARLVRAPQWGEADDLDGLPRISPALCRRSPDLDLLWHGRISTGDLHPLVRQALFPHIGDAPVLRTADPEPVRVRCRGTWHRIHHDRGRLHALDHPPDEGQREQILLSLGGTATGCFAAQQAWSGPTGRLPKALRAQRVDLWQRMLHGGTHAVTDLLDAGMDPGIRNGRGMTLLHMLLAFDHRILLPRLLAAGLDINTTDKEQRTPLHIAVVLGRSGDLIRAILDAGGDPHRTDRDSMSVMDFVTEVFEYRERSPEFLEAIDYLKERA